MITFRHDEGSDLYEVFIGLDMVSSITAVRTKVLGLTRLDVCMAFVMNLLQEKVRRGRQRQKDCLDTFGSYLCSALTQLVRAVR